MKATARVPGTAGTHTSRGTAGGHIHQLITLAAALTKGARAAAARTAATAGNAAAAGTAGNRPPTVPGSAPAGAANPAQTAYSSSAGTGQSVGCTPLGLDLTTLTDAQLSAWAQDLEKLSHVMEAMQVHVVGALAERVKAGRFDAQGVKLPADLFAASLKLSRAESGRRLRLAGYFLPTTDDLTLVTTPATQPVAASAFFAGFLSAEQAQVVSRFTDEAMHLAHAGQIEPGQAATLEHMLTGHARDLDPDSLARVGTRAVNLLDPDGQQPSEGELRAKQGLVFRRPRRGLVGFNGYLTIAQYEMWRTALDSAVNPHPHNDINTINSPNTDDDPLNPTDNPTAIPGSCPQPGGTSGPGAAPADVIPGQEDLLNWLRNAAIPSPTGNEPVSKPAPVPAPGPEVAPGVRPAPAPEPAPAPAPGLRTAPAPGEAPAPGLRTAPAPGEAPAPASVPRPAPAHAPEATGFDNASRQADTWPPPQGPIPSWAQAVPTPSTTNDNGWTPVPDAGTDADWAMPPQPQDSHGWSLPGVPDSGSDESGTRPGEEPWPHLVNGMSVSEPGSDEDIPGLDPIDPASTDPATQDRRTRAQRLLDATIDCIKLAARTGLLPMNGGLKTQLFISTKEAELQRLTKAGKPGGIAFLPYSGPQPLSLFATELCDADVTTMVLGDGHDILNVGRTQRLFTFAQRKILTARDLGCAFPDCTRPGYWTEAHHIIPWQEGGLTDTANGVLLCSYHHHLVHDTDWTVKLVKGVPFFIPPYKIDPTQRPRRNTYHHGLINPSQ